MALKGSALSSQTIVFENISKSAVPPPPPIGTPFTVTHADTQTEERILVNGFSPRSSGRFSFKRTLPLPDLPIVRSYVDWHPNPNLFTFEVVPVDQWMHQTGCNTRILFRVFKATGKPPLFWNTQLRLHPLNSNWGSLNGEDLDNSEQEPAEEDDISSRVWPTMPTITRIPFLNEDTDSEQEGGTKTVSPDPETRQSEDGFSYNPPSPDDVEMIPSSPSAHNLGTEPTADTLNDHLD